MKLTLEPTERFFRTDEGIPVRAWTGETEQGTKVVAFIAALAVPEGEDQSQFERELHEIPGPNIGRVALREDG